MPAGKEAASSSASEAGTPEKNAANRTTFRPPWVKEGPSPLPCPAAPWTLNKRGSIKEPGDAESSKFPTLRKVQKPEPAENGAPPKKETTFTKPQLRPVPPKEATKSQSNEIKIPIKLNSVKERELPPAPIKRVSLRDADEVMDSIDKAMPATRNALVRQESMKKIGVPMAPPMPPPPPAMPSLVESANLNDRQKERLTMLRSRPKTRPDWTQMLKEVESGRKLKHVECNDRSEPLLPKVKAKGQFLYDSEKQNAHNVLLKAIEQGVKLKKVKTNDRSKPILEGLRKFRRQMTIEEQIQKSQSMASIAPQEEIADEADEMDDIDKVRDDLQSTKQLLAFEMRNKEAQMRENKRLVAKIQQLEAELEKNVPGEESSPVRTSEADEKLMKSIKSEVEEARKTSQELEKKYTQAAEDLDAKKTELEEAKKQNRELEKKVQELLQGKPLGDRKFSAAAKQESEDEEEDFDVSESESEGSDNEEKRERRAQREVKLFRNKLRTFKNKEDNAKKERVALKELMKKLQQDIKEEKKKFKSLQKEVDKMASLMKDSSEDEEDDDDEEEEDEEDKEDKEETESESESSESESESSGSETDSEKSQSEAEDAPTEKIKTNLSTRAKRHENMLAALKKGNLMLKANAERLQDDFNKQRELTVALQEDLNSVLAELG